MNYYHNDQLTEQKEKAIKRYAKIKDFLASKSLPQGAIKINSIETINDAKKFAESHISTIDTLLYKCHNNHTYNAYIDRLALFCDTIRKNDTGKKVQ